MLARFLRLFPIGLAILALWIGGAGGLGGVLSLQLVVLLIGLALALSLGMLTPGFLLAWWINRRDPAPRAGAGIWLKAFAQELSSALIVFGWWQAFRVRRIADNQTPAHPELRGVVLLHGFVCNRGLWTRWMRDLTAEGRPFVALNLEPVFGSIDGYAQQVDDAVRQMTLITGLAPVLVCHSMGGLAARACLRAMASEAPTRVHQVITLGTPHRGTWLGRISPVLNGRQMRLGSDWIRRLPPQVARPDLARLFVCWYSNCDNIVFPASTATLSGADNRLAAGLGHLQMALDDGLRRDVLAHIRSL